MLQSLQPYFVQNGTLSLLDLKTRICAVYYWLERTSSEDMDQNKLVAIMLIFSYYYYSPSNSFCGRFNFIICPAMIEILMFSSS